MPNFSPPSLACPVELIQGMTYLFVRACVHYAMFEDEAYLQLQLDAIRAALAAISGQAMALPAQERKE